MAKLTKKQKEAAAKIEKEQTVYFERCFCIDKRHCFCKI